MTHTLDLGPHFDALIDDSVGSGRYADASALVRDALHLWEDVMGGRALTETEIIAAVDESRRLGGGSPANEAMDRIKAKLEARR